MPNNKTIAARGDQISYCFLGIQLMVLVMKHVFPRVNGVNDKSCHRCFLGVLVVGLMLWCSFACRITSSRGVDHDY
jgi:hypothetical protein